MIDSNWGNQGEESIQKPHENNLHVNLLDLGFNLLCESVGNKYAIFVLRKEQTNFVPKHKGQWPVAVVSFFFS